MEAPLEEEAPAAEPAPTPNPVPFDPEEGEEPLPEIKHVFLIVLDGHGYEEAFGKESPAPYLAETLAGEGKLLSNYYAVAQGGLANEIALLSGQGPTPQTAPNCPEYTAIAPGTVSAEGQVEGEGCVYPAETETLPKQLVEAKLTWKAYVEDIANGADAGQPTSCRHPALGGADPNATPLQGDAFQTWRNPFVYFAGLAEGPECAESDVGLDQLAPDLKKAEDTPSFSYIVPNACHDGSETPCAPEQPAGLAATRRLPQNRGAGDHRFAGLPGRRRLDRDHLRPGAPGGPGTGHQLLLRDAGIPEPARSRGADERGTARHRPDQTDWRRRPCWDAPDLSVPRPRHCGRRRLLQPLLLPAQRRGTVRTRAARLRGRPRPSRLRSLAVRRLAGRIDGRRTAYGVGPGSVVSLIPKRS